MIDIATVIPSRGRPMVSRGACTLFPHPILCVGDDEADAYAACNPGVELLVHPPDIIGMGIKRQWLLDHMSQECVFMLDDDIDGLFCLVGNRRRRIRGVENIYRVIENSALCAKDAGTIAFGYAHTPDVRHFRVFEPISFAGYINALSLGVLGRSLRFDQTQIGKEDIDYSLQVLLHYRFLWRDMRFAFEAGQWFSAPGGLAMIRNSSVVEDDTQRLKRRWGKYVDVEHYENKSKGKHVNIRINVTR